jgi:hypothetical protein
MKYSENHGSVLIVIIIIAAVVVLGGLGYVLWQNYASKGTAAERKVDSSGLDVAAEPDLFETDNYSLVVVDGFEQSSEQMFTYTASYEAVSTFVDAEGDYFEILAHFGGGGGHSGDYFWTYEVDGS